MAEDSPGESRRRYYTRGPGRPLGLLDDYLEGTAYGPGATYGFAVCTPVAIHCLNKGNDPVDYCQSIAVTHANAQSASVTLLDVYNRHFRHVFQSQYSLF
jgi:hypothetical protein